MGYFILYFMYRKQVGYGKLYLYAKAQKVILADFLRLIFCLAVLVDALDYSDKTL